MKRLLFPKPKVGDVIVGAERERRWQKYRLREDYVVRKVGRLYFYVGIEARSESSFEAKVSLRSWHAVSDYSSGLRFFPSLDAYKSEEERVELVRKIRKSVDFWGEINDCTVEELRKIDLILSGSQQLDAKGAQERASR